MTPELGKMIYLISYCEEMTVKFTNTDFFPFKDIGGPLKDTDMQKTWTVSAILEWQSSLLSRANNSINIGQGKLPEKLTSTEITHLWF